MPETEDEAQYHEARFLALISGLSGSAMQHLGKVINPLTGKIERDLQAAKETIDLIRMLREKTKGNLTDREKRALDALLGNLQLNYLDELKAEAAKPKEEVEEKPAEEKREEAAQEEPARPGEEEKPEARGAEAAAAEPEEKKTGKRKKTKRARADE